ncbi:alpha/beta fold hydrolase [Pontibacter mangrovi]|nr:alpha/beta fold hydrolase [Pontibacter mangrovi]
MMLLLSGVAMAREAGAQELKRRADLGLRVSSLPDSLAREHRLRSGLLATGTLPASTADALGIRQGDILLSINKKQLTAPVELYELNQSMQLGQDLDVRLLRKGKKIRLQGKMQPRPLEHSSNAQVRYGQVAFRGGLLRTITYSPRQAGRHPAILFIPGFPCQSIDDYGASAYGQLIRGWSERGYVVMLVEKPGLGDNVNTPDCMEIDLRTEIEAFEQGLVQLKGYEQVDPEKVFLFGHSMGGIIAPMLSQKHRLRGVMVYGSPYRPWFEFATEMFRFQAPIAGTDYVAHEATMRTLYHVMYRFFVLAQHPDTIAAADPAYRKILQEAFQHQGGDQFWSRDYRYWQQIDELNLTRAWAETEAHVLSIWGEYDFEIVNDEDHKRIVEVVNHYHPGHGTFLAMPGTNHSLIKVDGMAQGVAQMKKRDPDYNRSHFNTALITETDAWIKRVLQQTPPSH